MCITPIFCCICSLFEVRLERKHLQTLSVYASLHDCVSWYILRVFFFNISDCDRDQTLDILNIRFLYYYLYLIQ